MLYFSGIKPNLIKSEIPDIVVLKRKGFKWQSGVCYIDLNNDLFKKKLPDCNRYSMSIENMENKKPCTRRENRYF